MWGFYQARSKLLFRMDPVLTTLVRPICLVPSEDTISSLITRNMYFPDREWQRRKECVQNIVESQGIDVLIVTSTENIFYLSGYHTTGFYCFQCMVIPRSKEPFLLVRKLEALGAKTQSWVGSVYNYADTEHPIHCLNASMHKLFESMGLSESNISIGFEHESALFPPKFQSMLFAEFPYAKAVDATGLIEFNMRITKQPCEISVLELAAHATIGGMCAARDKIKPGVRDNDIAAALYWGMFSAGGEYPSCPSFVAVGKRGQIGHATWDGTVVSEGDVVFLEVGGCKYRYHTAMMRTFYVGKSIPEKLKETETLIVQTLNEAMEAMRPGVPIRDVDAISKRILNQNPYGCTYDTRLGYSLGCAFAPGWGEDTVVTIVETETRCFKAGMVFHLLPFLMIDGVGTVGISETVIVTEEGAVSMFVDSVSKTPALPRKIICL